MISRVLNIIVIKRRTVTAPPRRRFSSGSVSTPQPPEAVDEENEPDTPTTYLVSFPAGRSRTWPPPNPGLPGDETIFVTGAESPASWGGRTPIPDLSFSTQIHPSGGHNHPDALSPSQQLQIQQ